MAEKQNGLRLLGPNLPTKLEEINNLEDPLLRGELLRAYALYEIAKVTDKKQFRKKLCGTLSNALRRKVQKHHIREALRGVRDVYKNLLDRAPVRLQHNLKSDGIVRTLEDIRELFLIWFDPSAQNGIGTASVEARTHWVLLTIALEAIMTPRTSPRKVKRKMGEIMHHLGEHFFTRPPPNASLQADIWCEINSQTGKVNRYGVGSRPRTRAPEGCEWRVFPSNLLRYIEINGEHIPVLLEQTEKELASIILKVVSKGNRDLLGVDDLYRFKLVVLYRGQEAQVRKHLRDTIASLPGFVCDFKQLHDDTSKYHFPILGVPVEIMVMSLHDYLEEQTADNKTNHAVYKGEKYLESVYEMIFPRAIYGVNWKNLKVRRETIARYRAFPL